jgi:2'-5' RNA ligase
MAMIALRVPQETSRLLEQIASCFPGENQTASDMHITVVCLNGDLTIDVLSKVMAACHTVTSKTAPFIVNVNRIDSFDSNSKTPIILPVESNELHQLNESIKQELDNQGIDYDKKYYKPHVTLSYIDKLKGSGPLSTPISWGVYEIEIYGGNKGNEGVSIKLPLNIPNTQIKLDKIATKIASLT